MLRNGDFSEWSSLDSSLFSLIVALLGSVHAWMARHGASLICVNVRPFCPMHKSLLALLISECCISQLLLLSLLFQYSWVHNSVKLGICVPVSRVRYDVNTQIYYASVKPRVLIKTNEMAYEYLNNRDLIITKITLSSFWKKPTGPFLPELTKFYFFNIYGFR